MPQHGGVSRAAGAARRRDEDELNAYVKEVVEALPPLTDE
jgi:hypothetical protein